MIMRGDNTPEDLGIFGISWQEKVRDSMKKELKTKNKNDYKMTTTDYVNVINSYYSAGLAQGITLPSITNNTAMVSFLATNRIDKDAAIAFINAIYNLSLSGKIDMKIYDPIGAAKTKAQVQSVQGKGITGSIQDITKSISSVLLFGAVAISLYYGSNIVKTFKK